MMWVKNGTLTPLGLRISANEIIKALRTRLRAVGRESQVVVLEVETDARKINDGLHPHGA